MLKYTLLRLHRWLALAFALPLLLLLLTGLILAFEPLAIDGGIGRASLDAARLEALLRLHDPAGKAAALTIRGYDGTLSIGGRDNAVHVDLASGERVASPGLFARLFAAARPLHERLIGDLGWLAIASTAAMAILVALGLGMGWPRWRNTLSGWHKGVAWSVLPLLVLSPATALLMAAGVTFSTPPSKAPPAASLVEAVGVLGRTGDLPKLVSLRRRGPIMMARLDDAGEMRAVAVTRDGFAPLGRNWPRLLHEGNWARLVPALLNVLTASALLLLLATGIWIWARRSVTRRARRA